jgi:hypothetical protein
MRVPEIPATVPEAMKESPLATSTACGYLVLYLRVGAAVFGAPQLHESGFLGSTSSVWQPDTFWNSEPGSQRLQLCNAPPQFISWTAQASQALDSQLLSRHAFVFGGWTYIYLILNAYLFSELCLLL